MQSSTLIQISPEDLTKMIVEALAANQTPQQAQSQEPLLSKKEVTQLLGITMNTLDKFIKSGTIPAYGLGARLMFKKDEVLQSLTKIN
jgi:excisionase family DNA binding protein